MGGGNGGEKVEFGRGKRASRIFRLMKIDVLMFFRSLIWKGQQNKIITKKGRKWPKRFFEFFLVEAGNLSNLANWIKNHCF